MERTCPSCARQLREGMNFCPGCGRSITGEPRPEVRSGSEGALHFSAPAQPVYPMPYFPGPGMYPPMVSGKRTSAIAAGIIMIIAGSLALICGLIYTLDDWWFWDAWYILAALCYLSFGLSLVGAMGLFRRTWRMAALLACVIIILTGGITIPDFTILSVIILVLGIVSIVLVATSWGQFSEPRMGGYPYHQMMPPMGAGMAPPPGVPPTPFQGGAPPPRMVTPSESYDQGAPPPPPLPVEEEQVVAYVETDERP